MKRVCPTIQELLAFDAVARHGSMKDAAAELCVSLSGVSKHVASLERFLGRQLVARNGRGIALTQTGRDYWRKIGPGLRTIEGATAQFVHERKGKSVLTLACAPTFLAKWLMPRLPEFTGLFPNVSFRFKQHVGLNAPFPTDIDGAIVHGRRNETGIECEYVTGRDYAAVYAPHMKRKGELREAKDIAYGPLLHLDDAALSWPEWGELHGLDGAQLLVGFRFAQYSAVIQAALNGLGVGLVPRVLVARQLRSGNLLAFNDAAYRDQGFFLCYAPECLGKPAFAAFRSWLLAKRVDEAVAPFDATSPSTNERGV
ncbi:LysR substrate-binding domain-containing protein [Propionivibrio soli]|uniref:LysR substrate-binding domain-containing protein n=1 Tax=Propionivibrio soli TaxID=2976531 RepID=UPI0021E7C2D5|nr:LysR substrate-binding domain-containing protein [Propionivibrio soli]